MGASLGLATALVVLAGCTPTASDPQIQGNELAEAGNQPCPQQLPSSGDPSDDGFGTEKPATAYPNLLEPQGAWVCQYNPVMTNNPSPGESALFAWRLAGQPEPVAAADIPALQVALKDLAPADDGRACTADVGGRWMVVYSHDGDLTGVVVDAFGCRDVRLTDNPSTTPPGADNQDGTVGGVLDGGPAILEAVGLGRSN